jgi:hypothetical protein
MIAKSKVVNYREKLAWLFATVFLCWGSWVIFLFIAPFKPTEDWNHYLINLNAE